MEPPHVMRKELLSSCCMADWYITATWQINDLLLQRIENIMHVHFSVCTLSWAPDYCIQYVLGGWTLLPTYSCVFCRLMPVCLALQHIVNLPVCLNGVCERVTISLIPQLQLTSIVCSKLSCWLLSWFHALISVFIWLHYWWDVAKYRIICCNEICVVLIYVDYQPKSIHASFNVHFPN